MILQRYRLIAYLAAILLAFQIYLGEFFRQARSDKGSGQWLGALKMGQWLGIRRLTEDDFLDFFDLSKIKFAISFFLLYTVQLEFIGHALCS